MSRPILDGWHWTKTLLACPPGYDTNRRTLYRGPHAMHTFARPAKHWETWQDEALQRACDELNKIERKSTGG